VIIFLNFLESKYELITWVLVLRGVFYDARSLTELFSKRDDSNWISLFLEGKMLAEKDMTEWKEGDNEGEYIHTPTQYSTSKNPFILPSYWSCIVRGTGDFYFRSLEQGYNTLQDPRGG